jgi:galactose mutarotase-like enzyme
MDFKVIEQSNTKVVFSLLSNAETRVIFPFDFELQLSYSLIENAIEFGYEVKNRGSEKMYFSIGAHPGFNLPSKKMTDYFLEFECHENTQRYLLDDGLLNGQSETILDNQNTIHLDKKLFDKDAIVLKNINSKKIILGSIVSSFKIEMSWDHFPYFGVWSKKGCDDFICLEPWCGIAGSTDGQTNIENKEGINELFSNEIFKRKYFISFCS